MKLYKPIKSEWISFLVIMPIISVALSLLMYGGRIWSEDILFISVPLLLLIGLPHWYLHVSLFSIVQRNFPDYDDTLKRISYLTILQVFVILLSVTNELFVFDFFHIRGYEFKSQHFWIAFAVVMLLTFVASANWYTSYALERWKQSLAEKERLQEENLQSEFENLRSQVNPHFLFNCLNTLSTLIDEDPPMAEKFVDEMSRVYRYLLRSNEQGLTTLNAELQFIKSYYHLLETRYSGGVDLQIKAEEQYLSYMLPPLTLQLLVENAVKHNNILKDSPLHIVIATTGNGKLIVTNNLQKKTIKVSSTKVGLENIKSKYKLLNHSDVLVMENEKDFSVILPLIKAG